MYRLIVIDDEDIIREGIVNSVPWNDFGFEVVGEASNGIEAVDIIQQVMPDLILTDIKMPQMDGIELIEYLSAKYPDIKIIILSGYSELEYMKKAIKNRVIDYLSKPTCYEEFVKVFENVKKVLDEEKAKNDEFDNIKQQLIEGLPQMREKFLNDLIKGFYTDLYQIEEKKKFYNIDFIDKKAIVVVLEQDDYYRLTNGYSEEYNQLLRLSVLNISNQIFFKRKLGIFFSGVNDEIIGLCRADIGLNNITLLIQEIQKDTLNFKNISVSAGISHEFQNISVMKTAYRQAVQAVKQRVFIGPESIIFFTDIVTAADPDYISCAFQADKIINIIFYNSEDNLESLLDEVFKQFEHKVVKQYDFIDKLCLELLFSIARYAQQFDVRFEDIMEAMGTVYQDIYKCDSLYSKKHWLQDILTRLMMKIKILRKDTTNRIISDVRSFVMENYNSNSISLEMVSEKVNKNPAYLSKLFKMETGENFIDYVTKLRIQKAKELLGDISIKAYEISNMIGYADVSHFTKVFKKCVGVNPSEYRELLGKGERTKG